MFKKTYILFILLLIISNEIKSQNYFDNFPGIPVIAFDWSPLYPSYGYNNMKNVSDAVLSGFDSNIGKYQPYHSSGLKIIPYQAHLWQPNFDIAQLSEGIYIVWDAANGYYSCSWRSEGQPVRAMRYTSLGNPTFDNSINKEVIKTNHNGEGKLIYGPDYYQQKKYLLGDNSIIEYKRMDSLKITARQGYSPLRFRLMKQLYADYRLYIEGSIQNN